MIKKYAALVLILCFVIPGMMMAGEKVAKKTDQLIVWTSADREVGMNVVGMYGFYSKKMKWMDNVHILIWGPSGKLILKDKELQAKIKELQGIGVEFLACKGCADIYKISDKLKALGIDVKYAGQYLADAQKNGWFVLTF
ncbi:MAG: DsrE family protein [bacterium]|nr:DsrE family protein [bacterium]